MGLFSTSRAGVPLMNAYQFQTHASLPDLSLFANMGAQRARSSAASRASSSSRSSDGPKEGLIAARAEYESENNDIQRTENDVINSAYQQFIEEGGNDLYEFFDNHGQAIGQRLAEVQARKQRLRVIEPQLKRDSERYDKLSDDSEFLNVASLRMGPGNVFEAYGVRSDGTIGWGRAETMVDVYTNQRAMPYINAQSSMYGVEFPTKYDQAAGRNQLQNLLNSKQPNMIREGNDTQSFSQNFNALVGYLGTASNSLSPEERMSVMNEALMRSEYMPIKDSEGNEVGKQFLMPVYEYSLSAGEGGSAKDARLIAKPVYDENGNQKYIDPLANPQQTIQVMGAEIAATLAAGTEKIIYETRTIRTGGGGGRGDDRQRGYFFGVVNHQIYGDQIPFGFDQDYIDVAKSLQDSGLMINQSALRTALNNKTRIWLNTGTNREDLNSPDKAIRYRKVKELADIMESVVQNPSAFMPDVRGANRAGVQAFFSATGNGVLGIFARAGMSAADGVSSSPFSFEEIAANVIIGQPVTRAPMPYDVIDHLQQYRGAKLHNSSMIRIAGSDVKLAGEIVGNNSLPFEVGELAYSPAQFSSTANIAGNIEGFEELPSVLGYTYLRADELKNINMNTKTRKRSLHRYRDDLNVVRGSSIDVSTQKGKLLKQSIMQAYGLTEDEFQKGEFYRVPMVVPVRDWHEVDNFYKDKMRPLNQVFQGEEAAYVTRQLYDGWNWLQRTGGSIIE